MHAALRAGELVGELRALTVSGLVFGISKTAVTPPITAAREPVSRSSLCSSARLAEVHLRVDDAGEQMQPGRVDGLAGLARCQAADGRDFPRFDANVGEAFAGMIDEGGAFDEEIEVFGQG